MANYRVKVDASKLDKSAFFKGAKGTYFDLVLWENDSPDEWGNTHSVKQDMGKDRKGERTPYVGNAKPFGHGSTQSQPSSQAHQKPRAQQDDEDDSIPF